MTQRIHQITLNGADYRLHFTMKAFRCLRDMYGIEMTEWGIDSENPEKDFDVLDLPKWVQAGLCTHHPEVTLDDTDSWIDPDNLEAVIAAVDTALILADQSDVEASNGRPTAASGQPLTGAAPSESRMVSVDSASESS